MADSDLAHISAYVRGLVGDPDCERFTDSQILRALKVRRKEARYWSLVPVETRASGGTVTYKIFYAPDGYEWWDKAASFVDSNYDAVTPATYDWDNARFEFSTEPNRPVHITGYTYDVYGAAADLLENRGATVAEDIQSFSVAHGSFTYADKRVGPLEQAQIYRRRQWQSVGTFIRTDTANGYQR